MKEREEVLVKFEEMRDLMLRRRKDEYLSKTPMNCVSNERLRVKGEGLMGFCQNPDVLNRTRAKLVACNDLSVSDKCKFWRCRNTKESVEREFEAILREPSRCGNEYPKLAILIWFLQDLESPMRATRLKLAVGAVFKSMFRLVTGRWW